MTITLTITITDSKKKLRSSKRWITSGYISKMLEGTLFLERVNTTTPYILIIEP